MVLNKKTLIKQAAEKSGIPINKAAVFFNNVFAQIIASVKNEQNVRIYTFGTFYSTTSAPRKVRNIRTGDAFLSSTRRRIRFKPSEKLRQYLNDPDLTADDAMAVFNANEKEDKFATDNDL